MGRHTHNIWKYNTTWGRLLDTKMERKSPTKIRGSEFLKVLN